MKFVYIPNAKLCVCGINVTFSPEGEYSTDDEAVKAMLEQMPEVKKKITIQKKSEPQKK